ncbi:MAG: archease [Thermoprotei archaeon]|nr:MAG: archease [Thermoprotei archaeon]RLF02625.1 MAG: archease [Thermoprotei archaeon]
MSGFRFLEHIADVYIEATGKTLKEAFEQAALAMFEVITDTSKVEPKVCKEIRVNGFDEFSLLYNWLEELLFLHDLESLVFSKFKVHEINRNHEEWTLRGEAWGEPFDESRHEKRTEVKAITYSRMEVIKKGDNHIVRFVLDI